VTGSVSQSQDHGPGIGGVGVVEIAVDLDHFSVELTVDGGKSLTAVDDVEGVGAGGVIAGFHSRHRYYLPLSLFRPLPVPKRPLALPVVFSKKEILK